MQLKQAIKFARGIHLYVCDSDGIPAKFNISKKDVREAYKDELSYEIDYLNSRSNGTQFHFDRRYVRSLEIYIG